VVTSSSHHRPQRSTLQSYWICSIAIGALMPIRVISRDIALEQAQGRLDEIQRDFRAPQRRWTSSGVGES